MQRRRGEISSRNEQDAATREQVAILERVVERLSTSLASKEKSFDKAQELLATEISKTFAALRDAVPDKDDET
ncbi:MAG TPA: hypothetical protein VJ023_07440 [Pyrinomonadaceae bacterium]|nr:hypothetical protein [Pyrinomonadaceae bacterium]